MYEGVPHGTPSNVIKLNRKKQRGAKPLFVFFLDRDRINSIRENSDPGNDQASARLPAPAACNRLRARNPRR